MRGKNRFPKETVLFLTTKFERNEIREEKPHRKKDAIIRVPQRTDTEKLTVREIPGGYSLIWAI